MNNTVPKQITRLQNRLNETLSSYINTCSLSRGEQITSLFSLRIASRGHASTVAEAYRIFSEASTRHAEQQKIRIENYSGNNPAVLAMMDKLSNLNNDLVGAYIHGSLATGEECNYSDFDALVIIRHDTFSSPARLASLAYKLTKLRRLMQRFDPLQHHGWFVLTDADLGYYCDSIFPAALFEYSRSLMQDHGLDLTIYPRDSSFENNQFFLSLCNSIISRLQDGYRPANIFQAKSLLSQFMLLPAAYLQAKHNTCVYKRLSFNIAREDFSGEEWLPMDESTEIRAAWNYSLSRFSRLCLTSPIAARRVFTTYFSPAINSELSDVMNAEFYKRMTNLAIKMKLNIEHKV